jgi:16S rRNA G1207 methylase RsmC
MVPQTATRRAVAWMSGMNTTHVRCWHIGLPPAGLVPGDGLVAFTATELENARRSGGASIGFHEAVSASLPRASRVEVRLPTYRGMSLVPVLSWLVTRLASSEAVVAWYLDKQQGPDSIRRLLEGLGWKLERDRRGRTVRLLGAPPSTAAPPAPRRFTAILAGKEVELAADYGVFSPDHVDAGTALLLGIGLRQAPVEQLADIGVGYGPLAIGLLLGGIAGSAIATDVDCIALWLAAENARACGVSLSLVCTPDPSAVDPTPLTVCNVPTHINSRGTERFMAALARRARHGRLLAVVHASLEARYTRHVEAAGLQVRLHHGRTHVVLDVVGR